MSTSPEPEVELKIPDSICRDWWLVADVPFREMTREQYETERDEMAPYVFENLNCFTRQEQLIVQRLKRPGISKTDERHLRSALVSGIASIKRREKAGHLVSCFGVRSQRAKGSSERYGSVGDCRRLRCNRRSRFGRGRGFGSRAG